MLEKKFVKQIKRTCIGTKYPSLSANCSSLNIKKYHPPSIQCMLLPHILTSRADMIFATSFSLYLTFSLVKKSKYMFLKNNKGVTMRGIFRNPAEQKFIGSYWW